MKTNFIDKTIKSTMVVRSRSRSGGGGDICGTTPAFRSDVNIATDVAIRNSFLFNIVKKTKNKRKKRAVQMLRTGNISIRRKMYAVIAVELGAIGEIFVQS